MPTSFVWVWLCLAASILAIPRAGFAADKAPDWMHEAARQSLPTYPAETVAVILLDECVTNVRENGEIETLYRRAYKVLRPEARERYGKATVYFDTDTKISYLKAWAIPSTGPEYQVNDKEAVEQGQGEELYDDIRRKTLRIPAFEPGSVVGYEYVQKQRPYVSEDHWWFQEEVPVRRTRLTLNLPSAWEIATYWSNHTEVKPQASGANQFVWEMENVPAIEREERMPSFLAVAGRMTVKYFPSNPALRSKTSGSWREIGLWYAQLTADRRQPTPEIQKKVSELTSGATTVVDKMRSLALFMQRDIRYVAIEIGIGGYQPHPAAAIFRNRYGDCKDKATLLSTMLHEIGVESYYVVIDSERGVIVPEAPSLIANHVILAIRWPDGAPTTGLYAFVEGPKLGKILIFDPTNPYVPFGYLPSYLQGGYGLLSAPEGGQLIHLPLLAPSSNRLKRSAKFSLTPAGALSGDVEEMRWGQWAAHGRAQFMEVQPADRAKVLEGFLGKSLNRFLLKSAIVGNLDKYDLALTLKYNFVAENYGRMAGDLLIVRPRVLDPKGWAIPSEKDKKRLYPVQLSESLLQDDDFEITLPAGYAVDELPPSTEAKCDYGSYSSHVEVSANTLRYRRTYEIKNVTIPADKVESFQDFLRQINADERQSAVLRKVAN